jgi:hypothetical protein
MDAISANGVSLTEPLARQEGGRTVLGAAVFSHSFTSLKRRPKFLPALFAACSLVGQLFPFSVNGATFKVVPVAISR